ncbi:MAG: PqqD family protein [Candidatus Fermentibacteria bacterium]
MLEKVYRHNPDTVFREIAGEFILVPIHHKAGEADSIYVLNKMGTRIWELVDGKRTLTDIVSMISAEYEVDYKIAADDLIEYVNEMIASGTLLEV